MRGREIYGEIWRSTVGNEGRGKIVCEYHHPHSPACRALPWMPHVSDCPRALRVSEPAETRRTTQGKTRKKLYKKKTSRGLNQKKKEKKKKEKKKKKKKTKKKKQRK